MKTFPFRPTSPYALALLAAGWWPSGAGAQTGASLPFVKAPVVQDVAPLGVKGSPLTSVAAIAPVAVSASAYRVAAAVKKLRAREITPQQAWDSGALDVDDLIYFLDKGLDSWGGFFWEKDPELRRALVGLLLEHGGERLKKPEELAPMVRLWLADYYGSMADDRVLVLSESILSKMKDPIEGENALAFQALERIAWFYRHHSQYEKSAEAWLRMGVYHKNTGWWQQDALMEAARLYRQVGNFDKAKELRAQVLSYGSSWIAEIAVLDQIRDFCDQGKVDEALKYARPLLEQVNNPDKIRALTSIAYGYYVKGNFPQAIKIANSVLSESKQYPNSEMEISQGLAKETLHWAQQWVEKPFLIEPLHSQEANSEIAAGGLIVRRFLVFSHHSIILTVTCDNPQIKIEAGDSGGTNQYTTAQQVNVLVDPKLPMKPYPEITVRSIEYPQFQAKIAVQPK